jgi:GAF domain-containing protein
MKQQRQLVDVLEEFARTMMTDFPIESILDRLVERIVEVLPITGAGVTLISDGGRPHYIAASDEAARRSESLQSELSEGPCLLAYRTGKSVSAPDLAGDERFPTYGLLRVAWRPCSRSRSASGNRYLVRSTCTATRPGR